jgi:hypothetical protein
MHESARADPIAPDGGPAPSPLELTALRKLCAHGYNPSRDVGSDRIFIDVVAGAGWTTSSFAGDSLTQTAKLVYYLGMPAGQPHGVTCWCPPGADEH